MPKVYIITDMNHNFDQAARYGELKYATTGKVPIFKTDIAKRMLQEGLEGCSIQQYYLLISGPAILCILATLIVLDGSHPHIKTLVFDAKEQDYVVRHLSI
jgi:hypothetical protein